MAEGAKGREARSVVLQGLWQVLVNDLIVEPASSEQMLAVLSNLTLLRIRAEYQTGADTGGLDIVVLNAVATPLPAALPLFGTILAGSGLVAWRRKRKAEKIAA